MKGSGNLWRAFLAIALLVALAALSSCNQSEGQGEKVASASGPGNVKVIQMGGGPQKVVGRQGTEPSFYVDTLLGAKLGPFGKVSFTEGRPSWEELSEQEKEFLSGITQNRPNGDLIKLLSYGMQLYFNEHGTYPSRGDQLIPYVGRMLGVKNPEEAVKNQLSGEWLELDNPSELAGNIYLYPLTDEEARQFREGLYGEVRPGDLNFKYFFIRVWGPEGRVVLETIHGVWVPKEG